MKSLSLSILMAFAMVCTVGCTQSDCDCQIIPKKRVWYLNDDGENLLYGQAAKFDPNHMQIISLDSQSVGGFAGFDYPFLLLVMAPEYTETYYIIHNDTIIDTLQFDIMDIESDDCCNSYPKSTSTFVNSIEVPNLDSIAIIK